jgi:hypothetical protein
MLNSFGNQQQAYRNASPGANRNIATSDGYPGWLCSCADTTGSLSYSTPRFAFWRSSVWILTGTPAILSWFSSTHPAQFQDDTSIKPWPFPSKSFLIYLSSYCSRRYSVATDSVVEQPSDWETYMETLLDIMFRKFLQYCHHTHAASDSVPGNMKMAQGEYDGCSSRETVCVWPRLLWGIRHSRDTLLRS